MKDIELRDFFAAQVMSGKVNDFYRTEYRKNISMKQGQEEYVKVSFDEATKEAIKNAAEMAYFIADELLKARDK